MANSIAYKDLNLSIGDTISINYKIKEGDKERIQLFQGILIKIKGNDNANRMITVRKVSKDGIGVEKIIPLESPHIDSIKVNKKSLYSKSKLFFIRSLSDRQVRFKLYRKS